MKALAVNKEDAGENPAGGANLGSNMYRETFTNLLDEYLEYKKLFDENPDARLSAYDSDRYKAVIDELNERCIRNFKSVPQ